MADHVRIDKWLWHARFYRTRVLAQSAAARGVIRLNGNRVEKCSVNVCPGDVLTLPQSPSAANITSAELLPLEVALGLPPRPTR